MNATKNKPKIPRHVKAKHRHREVWLDEAMTFVREHFKAAGYDVPKWIRCGVGWPSRGGLAKKKRTIGQAWSVKCSADGAHEIIISIYLDDPVKILGVLIHEVIHATVGVEAGHGKPFVDCMKAVGLCGKPTATDESDDLKVELRKWHKELGQYPHAKLDASGDKKQSTRLRKLECRDCGCKVRVTQKWVDEYAEWPCPCGGELKLTD